MGLLNSYCIDLNICRRNSKNHRLPHWSSLYFKICEKLRWTETGKFTDIEMEYNWGGENNFAINCKKLVTKFILHEIILRLIATQSQSELVQNLLKFTKSQIICIYLP